MSGFSAGSLVRLAALTLGTAMLAPIQMATLRIAPRHGKAIPRLFHRLACRTLGVRRTVRGRPPPGPGGLVLANHVSWLDIPVIGAELPGSFVAKSEVAGWPLIGWLASLQRTVYIDRQRRGATTGVASEMAERIAAGETVVLFAEGTTGDGTRILPLRSSLLAAAKRARGADDGDSVTVYPLTITYTGFHGLAGGRYERSLLAWYGDTELAPHLKALLAAGPIDVELAWGDPIVMDETTSRKEAARRAEATIRAARRSAITARPAG